jgi:hypothetical protein
MRDVFLFFFFSRPGTRVQKCRVVRKKRVVKNERRKCTKKLQWGYKRPL